MGTKTVRLDDEVYAMVEAYKRDEESFSEAIERLIGPPSLLELAGLLSDEAADDMREAIRESAERDTREARAIVERFHDS